MYIKVCTDCDKSYECDITYEPVLCECGQPLVEDKQTTELTRDLHKQNMPQHCKDANLGITGVRKIKTLGQQADYNSKKMGRAWVEEQLEKNKTKKAPAGDNISKRAMELPKGSDRKTMTPTKIDKSLIGMTPEQTKRYVLDGVKPVKNEPSIKDLKKIKKEKALEKKGQKTRIIST